MGERDLSETGNTEMSAAQTVLQNAIIADVPIVAILGQSVGQSHGETDRVCMAALERRRISGSSWNDIFTQGPVDKEFYDWLNERFERQSPSSETTSIADAHFSAVFTSSIDPVLKNLFGTDGRQPDPVFSGDPPPPVSRSKLNPRIFYLFGATGTGQFEPPVSRLALKARRAQHATPMLNTLFDVATPLGVVVVTGLRAGKDWLDPSDILGQLSQAPTNSVLWFGSDPGFEGDDAEIFAELIEAGIILRDERSLGAVIAEAAVVRHAARLQTWNEPGIVSFADGKRLITTASMRLSTEASASIIDDAWMDHLQPLEMNAQEESFSVFHSVPSSARILFDGVRRGYAIQREFELELMKVVEKALGNHANEKGAIVLSGQSGVGKSIALYRIASSVREKKLAAVLFARDRIPLAVDLAAFLSDVDKINQVTLLIVDALAAPKRYDALLESFRSRGHRIVIIGTSYSTELVEHRHNGRLIKAPPSLSDQERTALMTLAEKFSRSQKFDEKLSYSVHALAHFFWTLPQSRAQLARGLGHEARSTERVLRNRGKAKKPVEPIGALAYALMEAGYQSEIPVLTQLSVAEGQDDAAGRLIDYVMACSRVHRWVPINLVLRALLSEGLNSQSGIDVDLVRHLFEGNDLFRWRYDDIREDQLLVGARLQLEAQLICDQRLGGPAYEVRSILELISNATRAGPEGSEETRFVADIVYALGPDGPLGERYAESYGEIARALTALRKERGVRSARLMLQEATLRRHFIRKNEAQISDEERTRYLDEAREAIEEALSDISLPSSGMRAGRRTIGYLWVERAATYGFLATSAGRNQEAAEVVWGHYLAARQAARNAISKAGTYFPIDISLWTSIGVLESNVDLGIERSTELKADILSTIEMVNVEELDVDQAENFHRQRLRAAQLLGDMELSNDAFLALDLVGSAVGYYFRARKLAPGRPKLDEPIGSDVLVKAEAAAKYLLQHRDRVADDPRCIRLLLSCFWLWKTGGWLLQGLHQPIPPLDSDRSEILGILNDLSYASGGDLQSDFRYLAAVLSWLTGNEKMAVEQFRQLARDTEYVEGKRVLPRNVITNETGEPVTFSGVVQKKFGDRRWSIHVRELNRKVDLVESEWARDVSVGKEMRFAIAFNYLGPIAVRPK
ncbi:hypothetical protein [Paracoccus siganidrum]|uniref:hypothetical protein n=1 Tax=Paracoccus siganidrum TaxID=1276757 RepID=UPI0011C3C133|nr:hypothetical protein [Paracoccus siganidrum]